jgi:nucleoid DNA-binding protein
MNEVNSLETGDNVYLRGFSFIVKTRAEKTGRNISKYNYKKSPAHSCFQTCAKFLEGVKNNVTQYY